MNLMKEFEYELWYVVCRPFSSTPTLFYKSTLFLCIRYVMSCPQCVFIHINYLFISFISYLYFGNLAYSCQTKIKIDYTYVKMLNVLKLSKVDIRPTRQ